MPNILLKPVDKRKHADAGYSSFTVCEREILEYRAAKVIQTDLDD